MKNRLDAILVELRKANERDKAGNHDLCNFALCFVLVVILLSLGGSLLVIL